MAAAIGQDETVSPISHPIRFVRPSPARIRTLLLLVVLGFVGIGLYRMTTNVQAPAVDSGSTFQAARAADIFPVSSPTRLPSGWRVLNSDFQDGDDAGVLRLGLRAADGGSVQLVEAAGPAAELIPQELGAAARPQSWVTIGPRTWQRYTGERGLLALVLAESNRTIILVGTAGDHDLRDLAGVLD